MGPLRLDGALATTLQELGLPERTPVDAWVRDHPDRVHAVHQRFAAAGARILFAGTFRMLPGVQPEWRRLAPIAVELARIPGCATWGSLGPGAVSYAEISRDLAGLVDGIALETFGDPAELDRAVTETLPAGVPVGALLVVRDDGRLWSGADPRPWLERWHALGVTVGFNCAPAAAIRRAVDAWGGPAWVRPSDASARELRAFVGVASGIGGCCGVGPDVVAEAWRDGSDRTE